MLPRGGKTRRPFYRLQDIFSNTIVAAVAFEMRFMLSFLRDN
jgi:hypothetical protein